MKEEEWEDKLTPEEFYILRKKGTEPAFSGKLLKNKKKGKRKAPMVEKRGRLIMFPVKKKGKIT